jgi:hypothetical protein
VRDPLIDTSSVTIRIGRLGGLPNSEHPGRKRHPQPKQLSQLNQAFSIFSLLNRDGPGERQHRRWTLGPLSRYFPPRAGVAEWQTLRT